MIIELNQGANATAVLADDLGQLGNRITAAVERFGARSIGQAIPIAGAGFQKLLTHLNTTGEFSFSATQSLPATIQPLDYFLQQYALLGTQDLLTLVWRGSQWFFLNAVLTGVERLPAPASDGVKLSIRYTFLIGQPYQTSNPV